MKHEFAISDPLFRRPTKQINGNIRLNLARLKRTTNFISAAIKPTGMLGIKSNNNSFHYFIFAIQMLLPPSRTRTRRQERYRRVPDQGIRISLRISVRETSPTRTGLCTQTLQGCLRKIHIFVCMYTYRHTQICISAQQTDTPTPARSQPVISSPHCPRHK